MRNLEAYERNKRTMKTLYGLSEKEFTKLARKQMQRTQQEQNALRADSTDTVRLDLKDLDGKPLTVTREDCNGDGVQIDKARARNLARAQTAWLSKGWKQMASTPHMPALDCASINGQ